MAPETLYQVLGVPMDASSEDLKKAYLRVARECHPDRNGDNPSAVERFKRAAEALAILSDKDKRRAYDRSILAPQSVTDLLLRNQAGHRLISPLLPKAPAEPKPGTHLATVIMTESGELRWERIPGQGEVGRNNAESGDSFTIRLPKKTP